jgi:hypothetical protein
MGSVFPTKQWKQDSTPIAHKPTCDISSFGQTTSITRSGHSYITMCNESPFSVVNGRGETEHRLRYGISVLFVQVMRLASNG